MNYKTNGVIIKRRDFAESDRLLTIFTERFGKVKALARGVRKIQAKMAGSLEPFMAVDLQLYEGKTFYTVTGASIIEDYPNVHTDLQKMADAFYVGELIDKFEKDHQRSPETFQLLVQSLEAIDRSNDFLILRTAEIGLLKIAGFWPDLSHCRHCKKQLELEENYWDGSEGGIICTECQMLFRHGRVISNDTIKLLRLMERERFTIIDRIRLSSNVRREIEEILVFYVRDVLESDLRSERFLHSLSH